MSTFLYVVEEIGGQEYQVSPRVSLLHNLAGLDHFPLSLRCAKIGGQEYQVFPRLSPPPNLAGLYTVSLFLPC